MVTSAPKLHVSGPSTAISQRAARAAVSEQPPTSPTTNTLEVLAGRYQLKHKVGEGGMGTVFVAHDAELDREVAVKMLAPTLINDQDVVERFEREAKLTAGLDHPNIVPIYDVGRHEGRPFIVMKLLPGDTLAGVLRQKGGFTSDETLQLLKQVASGLDYLHQKGFIHRDIKAGNIFLAPDGHATILDFGILRSRKADAGLTRSGMVMGTPHYMAPEQAMGLKNVDHRVDLYALAVVLFECLTGTLPFEADSELRLIQMQAHSPPPEILDRAPWIPKPVADVVKKALSKKPEDRYWSAAEMLKALEAAYRDSGGHPSAPPPNVAVSSTGLKVLQQLSPGTTSSSRLPSVVVSPSVDPLPVVKPVARRRWPVGLALVTLGAVGALLAARPWVPAIIEVVDAGALSLAVFDAGLAEVVDAGAEVALAVELDAGAEAVDAGALAEVMPDAGRPVALLPRKKGQLKVITLHDGEQYWAQVNIDGIPRGRTPLMLDDLQVGRIYQVQVERPGFQVQERRVVVGLRPVVVKFDLTP